MLPIKTFLVFLALCTPALAQESPRFSLPIDCRPGETCWIMNYPDVGPDKDGKATDPACLSRTYEDHKGTDFAIPDEASMKKGVDVLAARDGTITRVRNSEPDRWPTPDDLEKTKTAKRECGNAVLIDHGDGWQTMYCHLKRGSIIVKPNQKIKAGEKIGQVGLSGLTEFPHLHFGIIHKDKVIDPFTGADLTEPCGKTGPSLWKEDAKLSYAPLAFFDLGFDLKAPLLKDLDRDRKARGSLRHDAPALVFYAVLFGTRDGDTVDLTVTAPDGKIFARNQVTQDKTRARQMYYVGRKIPESRPLDIGVYTGKITIKRGDAVYTNEKTITVQ